MSRKLLKSLGRFAGRLAEDLIRDRMRQGRRKRHLASKADSDYPGDYQGVPRLEYAPRDDGAADPGEVVWTWVPYEEDHSKGKDRPVLVIGEEDGWLLVLQLTSKDHDRDEQQEARAGRYWIDIGTGEWDRRRRPSEARVNRIIRCRPDDVRRIGGRLSEKRFREVAREVQQHYQ